TGGGGGGPGEVRWGGGGGPGPAPPVVTPAGGGGGGGGAPLFPTLPGPPAPDILALRPLFPPRQRRLRALFCPLSAGAVLGVGAAGGIANRLAADMENAVGGLAALVGSNPIGIALGHHHAFRTATGDLAGGYDREAEPRDVGALRTRGIRRRGRPRLALVGQFTARDGEGLLLAFAPHGPFRGASRCPAADLLGEVAGVLDRVAIDRRDHVTGHDAGLGGRTVRLRVGDQRTVGCLETEIVGDFGGDGLDLHADPAAADLAVVL